MIFAASTDLGSAAHTSRFILPLLRWLDPTISPHAIALVQFLVRKAAHLTEYAILAALLLRSFSGRITRPRWNYAALAFLIAASYAAFDEFHQSFVPSRTSSARDVLIDSAGALIGLGICWLFAAWRSHRVGPAPA